MKTITITKNGVEKNSDDFKYDYNNIKNIKLRDYYYISKNGEKTYRKYEKKEQKTSEIGLARLAIQIFKQKLDNLTEIERNKLKTDGNHDDVGIWKDKNEFIKKWGNPQSNPSNIGKKYINSGWIVKYKEEGNLVYYFYNHGIYDSLEMCKSLMKKLDDDGKFIIELDDSNYKNNEKYTATEEKNSNNNLKKFPINQILYGPPGTGKTYNTINEALAIIKGNDFIEEIKNKNSDEKECRKELLENFKELEEDKQIIFAAFHQSMSYEDFIEGIKPKTVNSQIIYKIEPGIFKKICEAAQENSSDNYVLIIDEINRGNVSQIFGELITLIEEDKRLGESEELEVILPYSKEKFGVPNNLYIIGTMNTADRSVEALDTALRRRFSFKEMMPKYELLENKKINGINLKKLLETINSRIEKLLDREHQIGHSYFLGIDYLENLKLAFKNKIIPLLQEYFFGDYGKIGLVLGNEFLEKNSGTVKFAEFDYDSDELEDKPVYRLKNIDDYKNDEELVKAFLSIINE